MQLLWVYTGAIILSAHLHETGGIADSCTVEDSVALLQLSVRSEHRQQLVPSVNKDIILDGATLQNAEDHRGMDAYADPPMGGPNSQAISKQPFTSLLIQEMPNWRPCLKNGGCFYCWYSQCGWTASGLLFRYSQFYCKVFADTALMKQQWQQRSGGLHITSEEQSIVDDCAQKTQWVEPASVESAFQQIVSGFPSRNGVRMGIVQVTPMQYDHTFAIEVFGDLCFILQSWKRKFTLYNWLIGDDKMQREYQKQREKFTANDWQQAKSESPQLSDPQNGLKDTSLWKCLSTEKVLGVVPWNSAECSAWRQSQQRWGFGKAHQCRDLFKTGLQTIVSELVAFDYPNGLKGEYQDNGLKEIPDKYKFHKKPTTCLTCAKDPMKWNIQFKYMPKLTSSVQVGGQDLPTLSRQCRLGQCQW